MQFEGLRCTSSNIWTLPLWERRVLTSNRMTCVHVFSTFKKRRRQSLMRNSKESSASSTINGWLSCSWRTMTSGVCFQPQPQLIVMLIMMIYEDDDDGAGKQ